jgi:hypothetical protein
MRRNQRTRRWIGTALFETVGLVVGLTNGKSPKATDKSSWLKMAEDWLKLAESIDAPSQGKCSPNSD